MKDSDQKTELAELLSQGPPTEWYVGLGYNARGILRVTYNSTVTNMSEGQVGYHLGQWGHYIGNPSSKRTPEERKNREQQAIVNAERVVTEVTGFSPREIMDKAEKLRQHFRGLKTAPFEVELFDNDPLAENAS